jgi:hypothetical protein
MTVYAKQTISSRDLAQAFRAASARR